MGARARGGPRCAISRRARRRSRERRARAMPRRSSWRPLRAFVPPRPPASTTSNPSTKQRYRRARSGRSRPPTAARPHPAPRADHPDHFSVVPPSPPGRRRARAPARARRRSPARARRGARARTRAPRAGACGSSPACAPSPCARGPRAARSARRSRSTCSASARSATIASTSSESRRVCGGSSSSPRPSTAAASRSATAMSSRVASMYRRICPRCSVVFTSRWCWWRSATVRISVRYFM